MTRSIDTHHHLWQVDRQEQAWRTADHEAIAHDFTPGDLAAATSAAGVDATVLVQSVDTSAENDRLAAYAAEVPLIAGVVGWLPLADPAAASAELDRIAGLPRLHGVRCLVARDPMEWLATPAVLATLGELARRGLVWDVVPVTEQQVAAVLDAARAVPELRIVVDHLCRPPLDAGADAMVAWRKRIRDLSGCPGVGMKVSVGIDVLTSWSQWRPEALRGVVADALDAFGPRRLMLASNWPVILLRQTYAGAWEDLVAAVRAAGATDADVAEVGGGTATRWYGLDAY